MIPQSPDAIQALVTRAGIVANVRRAGRHGLEAIVSDRCTPAETLVAGCTTWGANVRVDPLAKSPVEAEKMDRHYYSCINRLHYRILK